jgi:pilus assembly protein Flp/PilA
MGRWRQLPPPPAAAVRLRRKPRHKGTSEENKMKNLQKFIHDEEGLTTVEYAIAGGLVGAGVILAFSNLGVQVARIINEIVTKLTAITIN